MDDLAAVKVVLEALDAMNVGYMIVGSFASNAYGIPRSTKDADFVVDAARLSIAELQQRLPPQIRLDPQMRFESITGTTYYVLEVRATDFKMELFLLSDAGFQQVRFSRRRREFSPGLSRDVYLMTPEDVVIAKLQWSKQGQRNKDIEDVRSVIAVRGKQLDWDYIHRWCEEQGTWELAQKIRASVPEI